MSKSQGVGLLKSEQFRLLAEFNFFQFIPVEKVCIFHTSYEVQFTKYLLHSYSTLIEFTFRVFKLFPGG